MHEFSGSETTVPDSIRVFRGWNMVVRHGKIMLDGTYVDTWVTNKLRAECHANSLTSAFQRALSVDLPEEHTAPLLGCKCGIYAYYNADLLVQSSDIVLAWGSIRVSGRVLMGTKGVRAEFGEIESLYLDPDMMYAFSKKYDVSGFQESRLLRERFGNIPQFYRKKKWLKKFPPEDVSNLVGDDIYKREVYKNGGIIA
jgi:hypothetical protein